MSEKELVHMRTRNSKTFDLGGGQFRAEHFIAPRHWISPSGTFHDIDTNFDTLSTIYSLTLLSGLGYTFTHKHGGFVRAELIKAGDFTSFDLTNRTSSGNLVTWHDVVSGLDISLRLRPQAIQFLEIIKTPDAPKNFEFQYTGSGSLVTVDHDASGYDADGNICQVTGASGQVVFTGLAKVKDPITRIKSWKEAVYPVTIDPTVSATIKADADDGYDNGITFTSNHNLDFLGLYTGSHYSVGFRMAVNVPQAAIIQSGLLTFYHTTGIASAASGNIVNADTVAPWNGSNLPSLQSFAQTIPMSGGGSQTFATIDLTSGIQTVVNRPGWAANNYMGFVLKTGGPNYGYIYDYHFGSSNGTRVASGTILYSGGSFPTLISGGIPLYMSTGCAAGLLSSGDITFTSTSTQITGDVIVASGQDGGNWTQAGVFNPNANCTIGFNGAVSGNAYFRFNNVQIPNSAIVTSGTLGYKLNTAPTVSGTFIIIGAASDNAPMPTTYASVASGTRTLSNVFWPNPVGGSSVISGLTYDFSPVLQEIVNRPGWSKGNSVIIYIQESGLNANGTFTAIDSYSTLGSGLAPVLWYGYKTTTVQDLSPYPSGHWINSDGGSGNFWNYVNSDPNSPVTDSNYIFTTQSGYLDTTSKIYYSTEISGVVYNKSYNTSSSKNITLSSGDIIFDVSEGYIYTTNPTDPLGYINIFRDVSDYSSPYPSTNIKTVQTGLAKSKILYDRKYKRIFYISNDYVYYCTLDDTANFGVYNAGYPIFDLAIDYKNNQLYIYGEQQAGTLRIMASVDLISFTNCSSFDTNFGGSCFSYGTKTDTFYTNNTFAKNFGSCILGSATAQSGIPSNIQDIKVDEWNNKIYFVSGLSQVFSCNLNGGSMTSLITDPQIYEIALDGPSYNSKIDFNLTQLPSGFGTNVYLEQVTNAYVSIKAKEGFDFTNVYAKILKPDLKTVIWEHFSITNAQFPVASGLMTQNIGVTDSVISSTYNTLADWNGAVLRLECYSDNDIQPSGNFTIYSAQVNAFCSGNIIQGTPVSGGVSLFCHGYGQTSGNIYLFMPGQVITSGIPLFCHGFSNISGNVPLYISGAYPNASIPIFLQGPNLGSGFGSIPLNIFSLGGSHSGVQGDIPLFMGGNQNPNSTIPLFLNNADGNKVSGWVPLYTQGSIGGTNALIPLIMYSPGTQSGIPLYIEGMDSTGNTGGFGGVGTPFNNNLPLYIRTNPNATLPLFIMCQQSSGGLSLYQFGVHSASGSVPLVMPKTVGFADTTGSIFGSDGIFTLTIVGW